MGIIIAMTVSGDWAVWLVNERRYVYNESGCSTERGGEGPMLLAEHEAFAIACSLTAEGATARAVRYAA